MNCGGNMKDIQILYTGKHLGIVADTETGTLYLWDLAKRKMLDALPFSDFTSAREVLQQLEAILL